MRAKDLKVLVIDTLECMKAENIQVLDIRAMTDITDYMSIATGKSKRQVKGLANAIVVKAKKSGCRVLSVEGGEVGEWILVDLGDVVAHVMTLHARTIYNLEKLWAVSRIQESCIS